MKKNSEFWRFVMFAGFSAKEIANINTVSKTGKSKNAKMSLIDKITIGGVYENKKLGIRTNGDVVGHK